MFLYMVITKRALKGLVAAIFGLAACSVWAGPDARANGNQLVINEVPILVLKTSLGGKSPEERVKTAAATLLAYTPENPIEVEENAVGQPNWRVIFGGRSVVTITPQEAAAQGMAAQDLAVKWSEAINKALALGPIVIEQEGVTLPPDKQATIKVVGSLARKAEIQFDQKGMIVWNRIQGGVTIIPKTVGVGTLSVFFGPHKETVQIAVMPYAAKLPALLNANVLGRPAMDENIESAVRAAVISRLPKQSGCKVTFKEIGQPVQVQTGVVRVRVPVKVDGPFAFPVEGDVVVEVANSGVINSAEKELWYSNDPENVSQFTQLYWGHLKQNRPVRLLAHHMNVTMSKMDIMFSLINKSERPAKVSISMADAKPDKNPTLAGYIAGDLFLRSWMRLSGEVVHIPPKSVIPIIIRRVDPSQTMSALASLNLMTGDDVELTAESVLGGMLPQAWISAGTFAMPWGAVPALSIKEYGKAVTGTAKHVYTPPQHKEDFTYEVGGRFTFVRVGEKFIAGSTNSSETLLGNFGVQYEIQGTMFNKTDKTANVEVVFESSAGYSGAVFFVDGNYLPARILQAKEEFVLARKVIAPGESARISISTIPLSGANYPATIVIRPVDSTLKTGKMTFHQ